MITTTKFDVAVACADFASLLDNAKNEFPSDEEKAGASRLVEELHDLAECLAGDRAGEIYAAVDNFTSGSKSSSN